MDGDCAFFSEALGDGGEGAPGVEDVIEQQDVLAFDFGEMAVEEIDLAGAFDAAVVTCDIEAFDGERAGHAAQEVGGEDESTFEQDDDDQGAFGEILFDFHGHVVEALLDHGLIDQHSLNIIFHVTGICAGQKRKRAKPEKAGWAMVFSGPLSA